jgi:hypothetical protein
MKAVMLLALGLSVAQAAEPTGTVMLACEGTVTNSRNPPETPSGPSSKVIIFNFDAKTIEGFDSKYSIEIRDGRELMTVLFNGRSVDEKIPKSSIIGSINRVTGDMELSLMFDREGGYERSKVDFLLKCKPAQRMF